MPQASSQDWPTGPRDARPDDRLSEIRISKAGLLRVSRTLNPSYGRFIGFLAMSPQAGRN